MSASSGDKDIKLYETASTFLGVAQPYLEQAEAVNNLMLGLSLRLARATEPILPAPLFMTAHADAKLVLAAMMTPPQKLILYRRGEAWPTRLQPLADTIHRHGWSVPGVLGPDDLPLAFATLWSQRTGLAIRPGMNQRIYELRQVIPGPTPSGHFRAATPADLDVITAWFIAFQREALPDDPTDPQSHRATVERRIQEQALYLWEVDGQAVSLAAWSRPMRHGIAIGPVYTPPEQRGHGYASAVTAQLSQSMLDKGYDFCCLFTNLANPTSNTIYQRMGYRPVCDFNEFFFSSSQ